MATNPGQKDVRYEVITHEDPVTGDLILPIPPQLLTNMGWKEGDELEFGIDKSGQVFIKKVNK